MIRLLLAPVLFSVAISAWGTTLYSSGPISGTTRGDATSPPWSLSQPFTISTPSIVTDLSNVGIWIDNDFDATSYTFASLTWTISTSADGGGIIDATDTVTSPESSTQLTPVDDYGESGNFDVYNMSFSVPDVSLAAGTYYLTFNNGTTNCNCSGNAPYALYWDENGSTGGEAYFSGGPDFASGWSFQVDGSSASSVPEPGSMILLGAGLAALGVQKKIRPRRLAARSPSVRSR